MSVVKSASKLLTRSRRIAIPSLFSFESSCAQVKPSLEIVVGIAPRKDPVDRHREQRVQHADCGEDELERIHEAAAQRPARNVRRCAGPDRDGHGEREHRDSGKANDGALQA